jgi:hypothetical protein
MNHFATGTLLLTLLLPATTALADSKAPGGHAKKPVPADMGTLLAEYNKCYAAAVERENKKAEPNLNDLQSRTCRKERAALEATISPELKQMLQQQAAEHSQSQSGKKPD